jgi:hypothetical protein
MAELTDRMAKGWVVHRDGNIFHVIIDETNKAVISPVPDGFKVAHLASVGRSYATGGVASNLVQFRRALDNVLGSQTPTRTRTSEKDVASNYSRIARLIGAAKVEAAYDPYLNDNGLEALLLVVKLANSVGPSLRLLSSRKGAKSLTKLFVEGVFKELATAGEVRVSHEKKPHARYLLLTGGQALKMGHSWNELHKNEFVNLEDDSLHRPHFEDVWANESDPWL